MPNDPISSVSWRPLGMDDIPKIADWFWDAEDIALFDRILPVPINIDGMRERWRTSLEYSALPQAFWFIAETEDQNPAGIAGLEAVNYIQGDAIFPAFVAKEYRGLGLAQTMCVSLIDLAFNKLRLHRLTSYYRDGNEATRHSLHKVGFKEEGRFREAWFADGVRSDTVIVGLLAADWAKSRDAVIEKVSSSSRISLAPADRTSGRG